jgi:hypothetical protein
MQLIAITLYGIQSDRSQQTLLVDILGLPIKTVEAIVPISDIWMRITLI